MSSSKENKYSVSINTVVHENDKFITPAITLPPDLLITFGVQKFKFHVNKSTFIQRCPLFSEIMESKQQEAETNKAHIEFDIDVGTFSEILDYIQTGKIELSTENLEAVYLAADYFLLDDLKSFCCNVFIQQINCETVDYIHTFGNETNLPDLSKACLGFKEKHFQVICESGVFVHWDFQFIEELLCSDLVMVSGEKKVLKFLCDWLNFELEKRIEDATILLGKLRFSYLTKQNIIKAGKNNKSDKIGKILSEVASEFADKITPPRKYYEGLYLLGCNSDEGPVFERYCPFDDRVTTLQDPGIDASFSSDISVHVVDEKVYVISKLKSFCLQVKVYDPLTDTWMLRSSMKEREINGNLVKLNKRNTFHSCCFASKIYTFVWCGGNELNTNSIPSCIVYCVETDTWTPLQTKVPENLLEAQVEGTATVDDSIFMVVDLRGSYDTSIIFQFKPATLEWIQTPYKRPLFGYKLVGYKSKLLLVSSYDRDTNLWMVFNKDTNVIETPFSKPININFSSLSIFNTSIYFVGHNDDHLEGDQNYRMKKLDAPFDVKDSLPLLLPDWKSKMQFVKEMVSIE